jgi:hypothetical protein
MTQDTHGEVVAIFALAGVVVAEVALAEVIYHGLSNGNLGVLIEGRGCTRRVEDEQIEQTGFLPFL